MSSSDVEAYIETKLRDHLPKNGTGSAPTRQIVHKWEIDTPGYPERALRNGVISRSDLLPWALGQLKIGDKSSSPKSPRKSGRGKSKSGSSTASRRAAPRVRSRKKPAAPATDISQLFSLPGT